MQQHRFETQFRRVYEQSPFLRVMFNSEDILQVFYIGREDKVIFFAEIILKLLITSAKRSHSEIFLEKVPFLKSGSCITNFGHIFAFMRDVLHWLPVQQRIHYRVSSIVWHCPSIFGSSLL